MFIRDVVQNILFGDIDNYVQAGYTTLGNLRKPNRIRCECRFRTAIAMMQDQSRAIRGKWVECPCCPAAVNREWSSTGAEPVPVKSHWGVNKHLGKAEERADL